MSENQAHEHLQEAQDENHRPRLSQYGEIRESLSEAALETQRINLIIQKIMLGKETFKDDKDESRYPSYTNFKIPYDVTCRLRYAAKRAAFEEQLNKELTTMVDYQPTAYDAASYNRHLCITTLWPPLHNRKEIEYFQKNFFPMSHKQKQRLDFLMKNKII